MFTALPGAPAAKPPAGCAGPGTALPQQPARFRHLPLPAGWRSRSGGGAHLWNTFHRKDGSGKGAPPPPFGRCWYPAAMAPARACPRAAATGRP